MAKLPSQTAISVRQPWAWLLVHGHTNILNQDWQTDFRGVCLVHAGGTFDYDGYQWVRRNFKIKMPKLANFKKNGIIGWVEVVDCVAESGSRWFFGKYGFVIEGHGRLPFIPAQAGQRFYKVEALESDADTGSAEDGWTWTKEEDVGETLYRQLKNYRRYWEVSTWLEHRQRSGLRAYTRRIPPTEEQRPDEICFSAFHPREAAINQWYSLLVYAHLDSLRDVVRWDAEKFGDEIGKPKEARAAESTRLPRGTAISVIPSCEGVEFNPDQITFRWEEDFHRAAFRMRGAPDLAGDAARGSITFYAGGLVIGAIKLAMLFTETEPAETVESRSAETSGRMFLSSQVFISYSHKDKVIVKMLRDLIQGLGYSTLIDIDDLRAGQVWEQALMRMIERADIFQLFWSQNAAASEYVQKEWRHALKCQKFIVPVFWEKPLHPEPPEELKSIQFGYLPVRELSASGEN